MERVDLKIDHISGGISIFSCFQITFNVVEATTKVNYCSVIDSRIYCKVMIQRGAQFSRIYCFYSVRSTRKKMGYKKLQVVPKRL